MAPKASARPACPRVIVTRRLPAPVEARLAELFDARFPDEDRPMSAEELRAAVQECDVLVPTITDRIDADLIAAAGDRLGLIANFGNGVDHIALKAARAKGIIVSNTPGVLTDDTADMAMALILAVPRRLVEGERLARSGEWRGWSPCGMLGNRISGRTLGIVGMGRIGQAVARRAKGFGLIIRYHNRRRLPAVIEQELGAIYEPTLEGLLAAADILSIHCPLTAETDGLIGAAELALLGANGHLINLARGEIVDESALADALDANVIAGAGLDVFDREPAINPRLVARDDVLLLPHMASATHEAREAQGIRVIANIRTWADGHPCPDQVLEGWA